MKIALLGTRGIPANYSGFETFYENLAPRLAARGHEVTVYNRPHHVGHRDLKLYKGVRLVHLPSIATKHLDTITHTAASVAHGLTQGYDVVYVCGVGNAPLVWIPRRSGAKVILNVDGADWRRAKWGRFASWYLRTSERLASKVADVIIADNHTIALRYEQEYGAKTEPISYGANVVRNERTAMLAAFGLTPRRYVLWVGRLEPEARVQELLQAFGRLRAPGFKLVVVGDAPFAKDYIASLRAAATPDVVFTGYQFGEVYEQLSCHCYAYVQLSAWGTHPALLDQLGFGSAVVVRGTPANLEVIADSGLAYPPEDPVDGLAAALQRLIDDPDLTRRLRHAALERARTAYSWDRVTDQYETLFARLCGLAPPAAEGGVLNADASESRCAS